MSLRVKICGITDLFQAHQIVELGANALGFICVPQSPRYVEAPKIGEIVGTINKTFNHQVSTIGVFANATPEFIQQVMDLANLSGIQLHGNESPKFCAATKATYPHIELIKAFRIKDEQTLTQIERYSPHVDTYLLDAFHPQALGGTGHTWDWNLLKAVDFSHPWLLAGGLTPNNVAQAVASCEPDGIDLSSGVERSPGVKDLQKVQHLFAQLQGPKP